MDYGVAVILKMVIPVLKMVTRVRLAIFDQFMRLGPNLGPLAMVIGWIASMFACLLGVSRLVKAGADEIFVVLAFSMGGLAIPFLRDAMEILRENRQRSLSGQWTDSHDVRFLRWGEIRPTMTRINKLREWNKL